MKLPVGDQKQLVPASVCELEGHQRVDQVASLGRGATRFHEDGFGVFDDGLHGDSPGLQSSGGGVQCSEGSEQGQTLVSGVRFAECGVLQVSNPGTQRQDDVVSGGSRHRERRSSRARLPLPSTGVPAQEVEGVLTPRSPPSPTHTQEAVGDSDGPSRVLVTPEQQIDRCAQHVQGGACGSQKRRGKQGGGYATMLDQSARMRWSVRVLRGR